VYVHMAFRRKLILCFARSDLCTANSDKIFLSSCLVVAMKERITGRLYCPQYISSYVKAYLYLEFAMDVVNFVQLLEQHKLDG
jgi:hypothetical protein